jgi:predicted transposase/invertase (TIGR01784 family)
MQVNNYNDWPERSLYYLSRTYASLEKGQPYNKALPSMHIGILNFSLFPESPSFYSEYLMQNTKTHQIYSSKFSIRVLDLTQIENNGVKEEYPELYYWAKFFIAKTWEEVHMLTEKSKGLHEAVLTLKELSEDEKIRYQCEAREMYEHTLASAKHCGRLEGKLEGKLEVASKMFEKGMSPADICDITGLSESDLKSIL